MRYSKILLSIVMLLIAVAAIATVTYLSMAAVLMSERLTVSQPVSTSEEALRDYAGHTKKIAITFDDGPHPNYTPQLLDGLRERGVKATFFIVGESCEEYPDIVEQMYGDGHLIGNHTYTHIQLTSRNQDYFAQELAQTSEAIRKITGETVTYVRPPFGCWNEEMEQRTEMFPVLWTIDPQDWCTLNAQTVAYRVIKNADEYAIILMHDCYQSSVDAALMVIDTLTEEGYEFVTVDEILFP